MNRLLKAWQIKASITEQDFFDFYGITMLPEDYVDQHPEIKSLRSVIVKDIVENYITDLTEAVYQELRHWGMIIIDFGSQKLFIRNPLITDKKRILKQLAPDIPDKYYDYLLMPKTITKIPLPIVYKFFNDFNWERQYGGKAWAEITKYLIQLKDADPEGKQAIQIIDTINDLEHNTGTVFSKTDGMRKWINKALDVKYYANSPMVYYNDMSKDVRKIVSDYLRMIGKDEAHVHSQYPDIFNEFMYNPEDIIDRVNNGAIKLQDIDPKQIDRMLKTVVYNLGQEDNKFTPEIAMDFIHTFNLDIKLIEDKIVDIIFQRKLTTTRAYDLAQEIVHEKGVDANKILNALRKYGIDINFVDFLGYLNEYNIPYDIGKYENILWETAKPRYLYRYFVHYRPTNDIGIIQRIGQLAEAQGDNSLYEATQTRMKYLKQNKVANKLATAYMKRFASKLQDILNKYIAGQEQLRNKEIAQLIKESFNLKGVPVNVKNFDVNTAQFLINNEELLKQASNIDPISTWNTALQSKSVDMLNKIVQGQKQIQLNENDKGFFNQIEDQRFVNWLNKIGYQSNEYGLREIYDWYADAPDETNLEAMNQEQAIEASKKWHEDILKEQHNIKEDEVFPEGKLGNQTISLPDMPDMYMVNLHTALDLVKEGVTNHLCLKDYPKHNSKAYPYLKDGSLKIYSLRDNGGKPYATIEVNQKSSSISQIKGFNNGRPQSPYTQYVRKWVEDNNLKVAGDKLNMYSWKEIAEMPDIEHRGYSERLEPYIVNQFTKKDDGSYKKVTQYTKEEKEILPILENRIIKKGFPREIITFAQHIKGADIPSLQDAIIKTGDAEYIYWFAREVKGADIPKLQDAISNTGNAEYIYKFAQDVKGADIPRLQDEIIKTGNAQYIYGFARDVKVADIPRLQDAIIKTGNAEYIYKFARKVKGADIPRLQDAVIKTGNAEYIYEFAQNVKGADIPSLQDAIIQTTGNAEYIYWFARDVEGVDIPSLQDAIIKTGDVKFILWFAQDVKGADRKKLMQAYNELEDKKQANRLAQVFNKKHTDWLLSKTGQIDEAYLDTLYENVDNYIADYNDLMAEVNRAKEDMLKTQKTLDTTENKEYKILLNVKLQDNKNELAELIKAKHMTWQKYQKAKQELDEYNKRFEEK